jgi:hypothetical protein
MHFGAALLAVAVISAGCGGAGSGGHAVPPAGAGLPASSGNTKIAAVPVPNAKFHKMAPLRFVNDPPVRFEYAFEAEIVCLNGPAPSDIDNDNDYDTLPPNKRGPIVTRKQDRSLPVGEFTLATQCVGETPTPSPSPTPGTRSTIRSPRAAVAASATPAAITATPAPGMARSWYVIKIDLADRKNPTVASGPAAVAHDALNFAAAAAPLQLTANHRYWFALAYQDVAIPPTPTPSPVPTDTPTPGPTDTPTPTPTISPCPGAVAITGEGTYCSWAVAHPPVDMAYNNPNLAYSSSAGAIGRFNVNDHSSREWAIPGTPYTIMGGELSAGFYGVFAGVDSPTNNLAFSADTGFGLTLYNPPPAVPAVPHNIATSFCSGRLGSCDDVGIANGDIYLYYPYAQTVDLDVPLTNPPASATTIVQSYVSQPYDILALTPDRHIVYATIDDHGANLVEHLLPVVLPPGYRITGLARNTDGVHFTASDHVLGSAPQGHGMHMIIDYTTFAVRSIPFGPNGETCDAMGVSIGNGSNATYWVSCVNALREYWVNSGAAYNVAPVPADGAILPEPAGSLGYVELFFTSYRTSSIYELQVNVYYPGVTPSAAKRRTTVSTKHP